MSDAYAAFLAAKTVMAQPSGFDPVLPFVPAMKPFQRDITTWACRRGRAAVFAGTGLGKTLMELSWALQVAEKTQGETLVFTPLAVAEQTVQESVKFGLPGVSYAADGKSIKTRIAITNYDRRDKFDLGDFAGIVCDESGILIIRAFQKEGWIYHSEVCIRKDPVAAMQRSKSIGLLHKQIVKDSALSRMAVADYVVTMRKPDDNAEPISGPFVAYYGSETTEDGPLVTETGKMRTTNYPGDDWYSVAVWQRYAEPVWMDINQSDVLSFRAAREETDERHIAPLQLGVIRRCIDLWSNPGDTVFSPFAGIGSELYCAVEMDRKALGAELKSRHGSTTSQSSYFEQAIANLRSIKTHKASAYSLFDTVEAAE